MITITPINNNLNFKSYKHTVADKIGKLAYRGDTCFFRHDLDFSGLIDYLDNKYKNIPKVNVVVHACSNGEEVFSFIAEIINKLGLSSAKKFLPILAKDIDKEHIALAKTGKYLIESFEKSYIDFYLGNSYSMFFEQADNDYFTKSVRPRNILKEQVIFKNGDILKDVNKINMKNAVLFVRNLWPYLDEYDAEKLAYKLSVKMDKSSTLIIGDYDKVKDTDKLLSKYGFRESASVKNLFELK